MSKRIMILLMAATLTGGLFAPEAQARGGGGGHGGGLGGGHIGGFHGMHIPNGVRSPRMGGHLGEIRMGGDLGREFDNDRPHGPHPYCYDTCGSYGCRYLWQSLNACY
jgi:hypothetical protein